MKNLFVSWANNVLIRGTVKCDKELIPSLLKIIEIIQLPGDSIAKKEFNDLMVVILMQIITSPKKFNEMSNQIIEQYDTIVRRKERVKRLNKKIIRRKISNG